MIWYDTIVNYIFFFFFFYILIEKYIVEDLINFFPQVSFTLLKIMKFINIWFLEWYLRMDKALSVKGSL